MFQVTVYIAVVLSAIEITLPLVQGSDLGWKLLDTDGKKRTQTLQGDDDEDLMIATILARQLHYTIMEKIHGDEKKNQFGFLYLHPVNSFAMVYKNEDVKNFITAATTQFPTTQSSTTESPTTQSPTTESPTTQSPTTESPTTQSSTTESPTTQSSTTESPTTQSSTTQFPTTQSPTTESPTTKFSSQFLKLKNEKVWPDTEKTNLIVSGVTYPENKEEIDNKGHSERKLLMKFDGITKWFVKKYKCPTYVILGTERAPCFNKNTKVGCTSDYITAKQKFKVGCQQTKFFLYVHRRPLWESEKEMFSNAGISIFW